jgi:hypothetical protein
VAVVFCLAYVGMRLGRSWETDPRFKEVFHRFHLGVEAVLLAAIIWFVWSHWKQRTAAPAQPEGPHIDYVQRTVGKTYRLLLLSTPWLPLSRAFSPLGGADLPKQKRKARLKMVVIIAPGKQERFRSQ